MNEVTPKSVFLVDDHPIFRMGLREVVAAQPDLVVAGESASLEDAKARLETLTPDVIVVDLALGDTSGLELVRWMSKRLSLIHI